MRLRLAALTLVVGLPLFACAGGDDDRIELPSTTTVATDPAEEAKADLCDAFTSYVVAEGRRLEAVGDTDDLAVRLEARRTAAIDRLVDKLPEGTPAEISAALKELRGIAIKPIPLPDVAGTATTGSAADDAVAAAEQAARPLKVVTDQFDATCETRGGIPTEEIRTTTTLPPVETTATTK